MTKHTVYLGLGTNLGDKERNIRHAVEQLRSSAGTITSLSSFYVTEPWGFKSENTFLNAVVCLLTSLPPYELLDVTQRIERGMGREMKSLGGIYHDRIIDIDILLYDEVEIHSDTLVVPHPLMKDRDFVMSPLREIMPPQDYARRFGANSSR